MASIFGRSAFRATRVLRQTAIEEPSKGKVGKDVLNKGAKRDPELYVCRQHIVSAVDQTTKMED